MISYIETALKTVFATDMVLFKIINMHHTNFFDLFFLSVSNFGNVWIVVPLLSVFILRRVPKSKRKRILLIVAVILSLSIIFNLAIKQIVGRPRPPAYFVSQDTNVTADAGRLYKVHIVGEEYHDYSFPSGHTNMAFAAATLAVIIFGIKFWPAFLVAIMVAFSRIYLGAHFPIDTLAGACLGSAIAFASCTALPYLNTSKTLRKK